MKPEKKMIRDLNESVGHHSIRLKVIEKTNTQISPKKKGLNYQRITFQDEEGSKIKTMLYEDEIAAYENVIHDKMEYDIFNAKIKLMPEQYRGTANHPYQLSFGCQTIITPVKGCKTPIGPEYISIASIPKSITTDDRYDVVAILIYMEMIREVPRSTGETLSVREFVVMDPSTEQPLIITAWAELAIREGEQLKELVEKFPVIGFTCLKPSYHKGFSLATMSTTFVKFNPVGEKAEMVKAWSNGNRSAIADKHRQVLEAQETGGGLGQTTIKSLRAKKAAGTLQDERHWLCVSIPEFDRKDVRFYLGCNHCGTGSKKDINVVYNCGTCNREGVSYVPRMNISFEAIDKTGTFMFTAFNIDVEKLLQKKVDDLYSMEQEAKQECLEAAEAKIRTSSFKLQVGPSTSLSRNGVLKWVLKQIQFK